jgi:hypothetical protein
MDRQTQNQRNLFYRANAQGPSCHQRFAELAFSDASSQWVMLSVSPVMELWFRDAVQALGTALVLAPLRARAMWHTHSLRWQLLRGLFMVSCSLLAFYCLQRMPVAEFTATVMLTPLGQRGDERQCGKPLHRGLECKCLFGEGVHKGQFLCVQQQAGAERLDVRRCVQ